MKYALIYYHDMGNKQRLVFWDSVRGRINGNSIDVVINSTEVYLFDMISARKHKYSFEYHYLKRTKIISIDELEVIAKS